MNLEMATRFLRRLFRLRHVTTLALHVARAACSVASVMNRGARGRPGKQHCGLRICKEGLEGGEDGGPINYAELARLACLLVPFEDGEVGPALGVEARDGHGAAVGLALRADSSPLHFSAPPSKELLKFLALNLGAADARGVRGCISGARARARARWAATSSSPLACRMQRLAGASPRSPAWPDSTLASAIHSCKLLRSNSGKVRR